MQKAKFEKAIKTIIGFVLIICFCTLFGCKKNQTPSQEQSLFYEFESSLTEQEHLLNAKNLAEYHLKKQGVQDQVKSITTQTIYSFDTLDAEYILIELEYNQEFKVSYYEQETTTKYKHLIIRIYNDEYYTEFNFEKFKNGQSVFSFYGITEKYLYCDNKYAYYDNGNTHLIMDTGSAYVYTLGFLTYNGQSGLIDDSQVKQMLIDSRENFRFKMVSCAASPKLLINADLF